MNDQQEMTGDELRQLLADLGWKQVDLARKLGIHRNTVSAWIADKPPKWAAEYVHLLAIIGAIHQNFVLPPKGHSDE